MSNSHGLLEFGVTRAATGAQVVKAIRAQSWSSCAVTVIGYGVMGAHYVNALRALGVSQIRVCSLSSQPLEALRRSGKVRVISGGFETFEGRSQPDELAIIATPTDRLVKAAGHLAMLGFRRLLIEKPVSLRSRAIEELAQLLRQHGVDAACAYNRVAYPSFREVVARAAEEGGIRSCVYTFTEMVKLDWPQRFPPEELARWGIANSLHVIGMAHGLIGLPRHWNGYRTGGLPWHPAGGIFTGAGISECDIPFSYHADWQSTGRWSVEVHTAGASYRLCPLEQLFRRTSALADWEPVPLAACAPQVKAGLAEEVAAMLSPEIRLLIPLVSLEQAAALTRYAEVLFGYE